MKIRTIVPRMGEPEQYIGKPFINENRETIGSIIECKEKGNYFELTIDAQLSFDTNEPIMSFSMKGV